MIKFDVKKYNYLGCVGLTVPEPWKPIVYEAIQKIDKIVKPVWIPRVLVNKIWMLGTGESIVKVKSKFWYFIYRKITKKILIKDIKIKFAGLRIYGDFNEEINKIVSEAVSKCDKTCEYCGSIDKVRRVEINRWVRNVCKKCESKERGKFKNKNNK